MEPSLEAVELGAGKAVAKNVCKGQVLPTYVGRQFERVALQWAARSNASGSLPLLAASFGSWWGTDPQEREAVDIDLIAASKQDKKALFGECKWRNDFNETEAIETLEHRAALVSGFKEKTYALFSKHPVSTTTKRKYSKRSDILLVSAKDLFK